VLLSITTTGKVLLLVVAGAFIVYALVCAILIPRRSPGFPGTHLGAFLAVTALFFLVQMGTVYYVTGYQEAEHEEVEAVEPEPETAPPETGTTETETAPTETETAPTETEPAETETEPEETETEGATTGEGEAEGDPAAGKEVFASAGCGSCHTLADAGSSGTVGPSLDDSRPPFELVVVRVTEGRGVMPSFRDQLSEEQIRDVAAYVSSVAGR
jgi:cytochrome c553